MIQFARVVDQMFLPSILLGVVLGIAWRYVPVGRCRTALQWIASLLFFLPQPFALFLGAYSSVLRLYQQVLLALWGLGSCAFLVWRTGLREAQPAGVPFRRAMSWRQTAAEARETEAVLRTVRNRPNQARSRVVLAMTGLVMGTLGVWCGWTVVGDYALTPRVVAGKVEGARVVSGTRSPSTYRVIIDQQAYNITRDLLGQLQPGDVVEADVGVASGTILAIRSHSRSSRVGILR